MANGPAIAVGLSLLGLAIIGYVIPLNEDGFTIPQANNLCESGIGQIGQLFSKDAQENCLIFNYIFLGINGLGLIGIILIIIGIVYSPSHKKVSYQKETKEDTPLEILEKRYARGEIPKEEFDKMKEDLN